MVSVSRLWWCRVWFEIGLSVFFLVASLIVLTIVFKSIRGGRFSRFHTPMLSVLLWLYVDCGDDGGTSAFRRYCVSVSRLFSSLLVVMAAACA